MTASDEPTPCTVSRRPLRLALFESQPLFLAGMRAALDAELDDLQVLDPSGPFDPRAMALMQPLDMVVLGLATTHDMVDTLEELRSVAPDADTRVVLIAPHGTRSSLELALPLIDAFIVRTAARHELPSAIEDVRAGRSYMSPEVCSARRRYADGPRSDPLTARELTVVKLIALGHHNREIAHQLGLSVRTIESHRAHALDKLQLTSRSQLVRWAIDDQVI